MKRKLDANETTILSAYRPTTDFNQPLHSTEHFKTEKQDLNKNRMKLHKHLTHLNLGFSKKMTGTYESSKEKWNVSTYCTHNTIKLSH